MSDYAVLVSRLVVRTAPCIALKESHHIILVKVHVTYIALIIFIVCIKIACIAIGNIICHILPPRSKITHADFHQSEYLLNRRRNICSGYIFIHGFLSCHGTAEDTKVSVYAGIIAA